jgi:hypothetical protein
MKDRKLNMSLPFILIVAGFVLLGLGIWSLWAGKTIGLYGIVESRSSIFFWIIVLAYFVIGVFNLLSGLRLLGLLVR